MRRTRWLLLVLALALLIAAAALTRCDDDATGTKGSAPQVRKVVYPRERLHRPRRPARPQVPPTDGGVAAPARTTLPADALERSVLAPGAGGAVFVELNAISQSALFDKILRCGGSELSEGLALVTDAFGLDLQRDLDRVAISRDVFAVSGYFTSLQLPETFGEGERLDDRTILYRVPVEGTAADQPAREEYVALIDRSLLLSASELPALQEALRRLGGESPVESAPSLERVAGELYGEVGPAFVQALLEDEAGPVAQRLRELVTGATVRMDVGEDVAMSLDLRASDADQGRDLARALAGAVAAWRLQAAREGDLELAALLEQARVQPHDDGRFDLDLAVTGEQILLRMGCDADGNRLPASR